MGEAGYRRSLEYTPEATASQFKAILLEVMLKAS
jgi:hypothetical protein